MSHSKFIMSHKSQGPMKMQKNGLMGLGDQWEGGEVCQGRDFVMTWPRRSRYHGIKLW